MTPSPRSLVRSTAVAAAALSVSALVCAQSPQYSEWGSVTRMEAGWTEDTMAVFHSAPLVNPSGCSITGAGYATNPADPGHSLFHTLILSAFLNRKEVRVLVLGCVYNKPRIIAVSMR